METQNERLQVRFDGLKLKTGSIDAYDLAVTVMAIADTLRGIANNFPNTRDGDLKIDVSALRPGSFEVDFSIFLKNAFDHGVPMIPLLNVGTFNSVKELINSFKSLIEIKKFLKGEKPSKIEINQSGANPSAVIYNITGDHMTLNMPTYNVLQDRQTNEKLEKVFTPLLKEGSEVDLIQIGDPSNSKESIEVTREEAKYFERVEELQTVPIYKIRGIVTAMDRKTSNGKLTTGDEKRCNFEVDIDDISKLDKVMNGLIDSMRGKVAVLVMGEAVLDLESNLKKIKIKDIEVEDKLFFS